ncbi:MAG: hypothetical protein U0136_12945 [Bdellovibrionota bacterium]
MKPNEHNLPLLMSATPQETYTDPSEYLLASDLFDAEYYSAQCGISANDRAELAQHYLNSGFREGLSPNRLFDPKYYTTTTPGGIAADDPPLVHYLRSTNTARGKPHVLFDSSYYLEVNPDVASSEYSPLEHYLLYGSSESRQPHVLFDPLYYADQVGADSETETGLLHYLTMPNSASASPHPLFQSSFYLAQCSGDDLAGLTPLEHFLLHGSQKGYTPHPMFSFETYYAQWPELRTNHQNPLVHYLTTARARRSVTHPTFDGGWYLDRNEDVRETRVNPLVHYVLYGRREKRLLVPESSAESAAPEEVLPELITLPATIQLPSVLKPFVTDWDHIRRIEPSIMLSRNAASRQTQSPGFLATPELNLLKRLSALLSDELTDILLVGTVTEQVAELVSCFVAGGGPNDRPAIVTTDSAADEEHKWLLPPDVRCINARRVLSDASEQDLVEALRFLALTYRPQTIQIYNSTIGWELARQYGRPIATTTSLVVFGCTLSEGTEDLAIPFLGSTYDALAGIIVENRNRRDFIAKHLGVGQEERRKFIVLSDLQSQARGSKGFLRWRRDS